MRTHFFLFLFELYILFLSNVIDMEQFYLVMISSNQIRDHIYKFEIRKFKKRQVVFFYTSFHDKFK